MKSGYNLELFKLKAELCKTFSDPKRLIIISELRFGEKSVSELTELIEIPQAIISRQLGILRSKGVVTPRRSGNSIYYRLTDPRICEACDIVHEVLLKNLARNKELAEQILV
jgi:DNA-binding transcriptional ArsR family regulator